MQAEVRVKLSPSMLGAEIAELGVTTHINELPPEVEDWSREDYAKATTIIGNLITNAGREVASQLTALARRRGVIEDAPTEEHRPKATDQADVPGEDAAERARRGGEGGSEPEARA